MKASDVLTQVRPLLGESSTAQRWSNQDLLGFIDSGQKTMVRTLLWPESRTIVTTTANIQEYDLNEVLLVLRVYLQGQRLVETSIPTMEGDSLQLYDQTGTSAGPGGLITNGVPTLVTGDYTPQWTGEAAAAYPVASSLAPPGPTGQPAYVGQRPMYYLRGGNLGVVPLPAGSYPLVLDIIRQPDTVNNTSQTLVLPSIAMDALAWKVCELAFFSDRTQSGAAQQMQAASQQYMKALTELKSWRQQYGGGTDEGIKMLTMRSFYTKGNNRN